MTKDRAAKTSRRACNRLHPIKREQRQKSERACSISPLRGCSRLTSQLVCIQGMLERSDIAFPEVKRNFIERALLPLFGFCEPEHSTLGIMQRALSAKIFLAADFHELPVHELHSLVKPIAKPVTTLTIAESVH
jgi:hypothetical protein